MKVVSRAGLDTGFTLTELRRPAMLQPAAGTLNPASFGFLPSTDRQPLGPMLLKGCVQQAFIASARVSVHAAESPSMVTR